MEVNVAALLAKYYLQWKGAKFAGSVGHPITKMHSASGGLRPLIP